MTERSGRSSSSTRSRGMRARRALFLAGAALLALYIVPFGRVLLWPLVLLSTLAHEAGHGIAALVVGGSFTSLALFLDGSGVAHHSGVESPLGLAVVAAGGLVGPSVVAALFFVVARSARLSRAALFATSLVMLALLVLVVRNPFGVAFTGAATLALLAVAWRFSSSVAQGVTVFLALVLALSSFSRADYLFAREAVTGAGTMPSDTMHIALALGGPHLLWAIVVGTLSIVVVVGGGLFFAARLDDD